MRTLVSSGRWRTERVNTDAGPLDPLTPALLRRFDVVAIDAEAIRTMPRAARAVLDAAVHDEGLGLLVDPVAPPFDAPRPIDRMSLRPRRCRTRPGRRRSAISSGAGRAATTPTTAAVPVMRAAGKSIFPA